MLKYTISISLNNTLIKIHNKSIYIIRIIRIIKKLK